MKILVYFNDILLAAGSAPNIHIVSSTRLRIPLVQIRVVDMVGFFTSAKVLGEGTVIKVDIAGETGVSASYKFMYAAHMYDTHLSQKVYVIDGVLFQPRYWYDSPDTPGAFSGTSHDALKTLSDECGMKFLGEPTSDDQVWHYAGKSYQAAMFEISQGSYAGDNSTMILACDINLGGVMLLANVDSIKSPVYSLIHNGFNPGTGRVPIIGPIRPKATPGAKNSAYSHNNRQFSLTPNSSRVASGETEKAWHLESRISVSKTETGGLNVSPQISGVTKNAKTSSLGVDIGNNHDNYHRAVYQNQRGLSLYNVSVEVTTNAVTDIYVTAPINLVTDEKEWAGLWYVTSRAITITNERYQEIIELSRRTTDATVSTISRPASDQAAYDLGTNPKLSIPSLANFLGTDLTDLGAGLVGAIGGALLTAAVKNIPSNTTKTIIEDAKAYVATVIAAMTPIRDSSILAMHELNPLDYIQRQSIYEAETIKLKEIYDAAMPELTTWRGKVNHANKFQALANKMNLSGVTSLAKTFAGLSSAKDTVLSAMSGLSTSNNLIDSVKTAKSAYGTASNAYKKAAADNALPESTYDPVVLVTEFYKAADKAMLDAVTDKIGNPSVPIQSEGGSGV